MSLQKAELSEQDPAVYKTLLESTRAIPWHIDWQSMTFSYIGPQIEELLGWSQSSWVSVEDWATRMHPEDRDRVVNFCVSQSQSGIDHEADYRALTSDGRYVWIRDVVHVMRTEQGEVEALVGFMFDISERKKTEQELLRLQRELEELSYKDGLTGLANRRMFDTRVEAEWSDARRTGKPLSLIMVDIDHFKSYNDSLGHLAGDDCLRHVALLLAEAAARPRDFVARYGGEEFVMVLPETDERAAEQVALRFRDLITQARITHPGVPGGQLTVSLGVGTVHPAAGDDLRFFIDSVDRLLYKAKVGGRNAMECSG